MTPAPSTVRTTDYHTAGSRSGSSPSRRCPLPRRHRRRAPGAGDREAERGRRCGDCSASSRAATPTCTAGSSSPPDDDGADFGVLFWHKDGFSTACGHGTIALGVWAVDTGLVGAGPERRHRRRRSTCRRAGHGAGAPRRGRGHAVDFVNVPSYVLAARRAACRPRRGAVRVRLSLRRRDLRAACARRRSVWRSTRSTSPSSSRSAARSRGRSNGTAHAPHPTDPRLERRLRHDPVRRPRRPTTTASSTSATSPSSPTARSTARRAARAPAPGSPCSPPTGALGAAGRLVHDSIVGSTLHGARRRNDRGRTGGPRSCPRSPAWRTAPVSTSSTSTRTTRSSPGSCCDERPDHPRRRRRPGRVHAAAGGRGRRGRAARRASIRRPTRPRSSVPLRAGRVPAHALGVGRRGRGQGRHGRPGNPGRGLPRIQALYLLFDAVTLRPPRSSTAPPSPRCARPRCRSPRYASVCAPGAGGLRVVAYGAGPQATGHVATLSAVLPGRVAGPVRHVVREPSRAAPSYPAELVRGRNPGGRRRAARGGRRDLRDHRQGAAVRLARAGRHGGRHRRRLPRTRRPRARPGAPTPRDRRRRGRRDRAARGRRRRHGRRARACSAPATWSRCATS